MDIRGQCKVLTKIERASSKEARNATFIAFDLPQTVTKLESTISAADAPFAGLGR